MDQAEIAKFWKGTSVKSLLHARDHANLLTSLHYYETKTPRSHRRTLGELLVADMGKSEERVEWRDGRAPVRTHLGWPELRTTTITCEP